MAAVIQRPLRGSRISTFYPVKSLPSLASLDSAFQLQEYISLLIRLDVHDVEAIVAMPGKPKEAEAEVKEEEKMEGEKTEEDKKEEKKEEKEKAPVGAGDVTVDESCWIYEQLRRLAQDLTHPLITTLQQECTRASCPEMKAGEWLYLCVAHGNDGAMEQCCAIDYILHTLDSATALLNSPRAFPSRLQIPPTSHRHFTSLARRLGRIFAHAYFHHREAFEQAEAESSLYARFLALTGKFEIVPAEFLVIPHSAIGLRGEEGGEEEDGEEEEEPRLNAAAVDPREGYRHTQQHPQQYSLHRRQPPQSLSGAPRPGILNVRAKSRSPSGLGLDPPQINNSNSNSPGGGIDSPRRIGRNRTDTMVFSEASAVADELAKYGAAAADSAAAGAVADASSVDEGGQKTARPGMAHEMGVEGDMIDPEAIRREEGERLKQENFNDEVPGMEIPSEEEREKEEEEKREEESFASLVVGAEESSRPPAAAAAEDDDDDEGREKKSIPAEVPTETEPEPEDDSWPAEYGTIRGFPSTTAPEEPEPESESESTAAADVPEDVTLLETEPTEIIPSSSSFSSLSPSSADADEALLHIHPPTIDADADAADIEVEAIPQEDEPESESPTPHVVEIQQEEEEEEEAVPSSATSDGSGSNDSFVLVEDGEKHEHEQQEEEGEDVAPTPTPKIEVDVDVKEPEDPDASLLEVDSYLTGSGSEDAAAGKEGAENEEAVEKSTATAEHPVHVDLEKKSFADAAKAAPATTTMTTTVESVEKAEDETAKKEALPLEEEEETKPKEDGKAS